MRIKSSALVLSVKQFRLAVCAALAVFVKSIVRSVYFGISASLFAVCGSAYGQITSVDADSFATGTVLTNAFPGVTLSVITGPNRPDGPYVVISATGFNDFTQTNVATTGSLVFGNFPDAPFPAAKGWEIDGRLFRADFATPTNWVSIDLIADDDDSGVLSAYGAGGELLDTVNTGVMTNRSFTATISRQTADIAFITAAGTVGETMFLDNLRYNNTTPPVLTLPDNITRDATSPAGAVVTYTVTATDNFDPNPTVTCSSPSGNTFPIGTNTVTCTATDASGNSSAPGSFTVTVNGAVAQLRNLIAIVGIYSNPWGITNSLATKLQNAIDALNAMNKGSELRACNALSAFVNEAQAQSGKKLMPDGVQLIASANQIRAVLGCP